MAAPVLYLLETLQQSPVLLLYFDGSIQVETLVAADLSNLNGSSSWNARTECGAGSPSTN